MALLNLNDQKKLLTLQEAARELAVSVDVLLKWNEFNILKPTITKDGTIGYTFEQIDQFRFIQKLAPVNLPSFPAPAPSDSLRPDPVVLPVNNTMLPASVSPSEIYSPVLEDKAAKSSLRGGKIFAALFAVFALLIIGSVIVLKITKSPLLSADGLPAAPQNLSGSVSNPPQTKGAVALGEVLGNNTSLNNKTGENSTNGNLLDAPVSGSKLAKDPGIEDPSGGSEAGNSGYSQLSDFSRAGKNSDSLFDEGGNIKGDAAGKNLLALALGAAGVAPNDGSLKPATNLNLVVIFMVFAALSSIVVLKKQLAYHSLSPAAVILPAPGFGPEEDPKIIEVAQKTDGTVSFLIEGNEYKLCKPELNSESDQFIERLLQLTQSTKELDYDVLLDKEIKPNAPLSKLVTRLGFVGMKRDLFFPRTSKTKVLFRKYLTGRDLSLMGLTPDKVLREIIPQN